MADEVDRSQQDIEFLEQIQSHPEIKLEAEPTGYCLFCGEKITEPNRRWCDAKCRDDWERKQINKR